MALDNLISVQLTEEEYKKLSSFITGIHKILEGKMVNLTPDERKQYGSIADRNKILVDKCKHYMEQDAQTIPRTIDKAEFDADYKARLELEAPLRSLARVVEKLRDTKTLLDHDNFHAAIAYYRYVKYLASQNEPGTTSIYQDLRKHYQSTGSKVQNEGEGTSEDAASSAE